MQLLIYTPLKVHILFSDFTQLHCHPHMIPWTAKHRDREAEDTQVAASALHRSWYPPAVVLRRHVKKYLFQQEMLQIYSPCKHIRRTHFINSFFIVALFGVLLFNVPACSWHHNPLSYNKNKVCEFLGCPQADGRKFGCFKNQEVLASSVCISENFLQFLEADVK